MKLAVLLLCLPAAFLAAADVPRITYSKSFPRSSPPYVEIRIDRDGHGEYREAADDDNPVKFQLSAKETGEAFGLAAKLDWFARPLESSLKVAFTGTKTFRWESGTEKHEVKFNYSTDATAQQIWDWFERVTESELRFIALERAAKFDKLGVNQALLLLESSRDRNRLVATSQYLPLLDRIVKNESYLHMARERAAGLADAFRNAQTVAP